MTNDRIFAQIYGEIAAIKRQLADTHESVAFEHTGDGIPTHAASEGVFYWDYTGDDLYVNTDSASAWQIIGGGGFAGGDGYHSLLSSTHLDTTPAAVTRGAFIVAHDPSATWQRLDHPSAINRYIRSNAADPGWTANLSLDNGAWVGISAADLRVEFDSSLGRIDIRLGDAAGSDSVRVLDSGGSLVGYIDSDGNADLEGHVAIGDSATVATAYALYVDEQYTDVAGTVAGQYVTVDFAPVGNFSTSVYGSLFGVELTTAQARTGGGIYGISGQVVVTNGIAATDLNLIGGQFAVDIEDAAAIVGSGEDVYTPAVDTGSATLGYGIRVLEGTVGAGSIGTLYGLYIAEISAGTTSWAIYSDGGNSYHEDRFKVGGAASVSAQLHVDQDSASGSIPVFYLHQQDVSEEFVRFQGTAASGVLTQSIVDYGDESTSTAAVWLKVYVVDDGNQVTDQAYHVLAYALA